VREKETKGWRRSKKIALIESMNSRWEDLAKDWGNEFKPAPAISAARESLAQLEKTRAFGMTHSVINPRLNKLHTVGIANGAVFSRIGICVQQNLSHR
jgi:hypothetical protein